MSHPFEEFRDSERIRLVEADLALTNEFIRGVITTGTAIRGIAVTIWLAFVGVALQQQTLSLALLAGAVAVCFWLIDGYYGWLYAEASVHARACETVLSEYYNAISRAQDDPGVVGRLQTSLRVQRFGLFLGFRSGYGLRQWWAARPTILYRTLYLVMLGLSLLIVVLLATGVLDSSAGEAARDHFGYIHSHR